jgi:hypothetical protein
LQCIESNYPDLFEVSPSKHEEFFYEGSIGLVGQLRVWLVRAFSNAMSAGETNITIESLKATRTHIKSLRTILEECHSGEQMVEESEHDHRELSRLLSFDRTVPKPSTDGFVKKAIHGSGRRDGRIKALPRRNRVGV